MDQLVNRVVKTGPLLVVLIIYIAAHWSSDAFTPAGFDKRPDADKRPGEHLEFREIRCPTIVLHQLT
jgi:hypothetical protein